MVWEPKWHKDLMSEEAKLALDIFNLNYSVQLMNSPIDITDKAIQQLKKLIQDAPKDIDSLVVGVDKSGCSGYSYKLEFGNSSQIKNFDLIKKDNVKVFIDPKAIMFLVGSTMDYHTDKYSSRFIFNNPNEKNTCGCGESFNV